MSGNAEPSADQDQATAVSENDMRLARQLCNELGPDAIAKHAGICAEDHLAWALFEIQKVRSILRAELD